MSPLRRIRVVVTVTYDADKIDPSSITEYVSITTRGAVAVQRMGGDRWSNEELCETCNRWIPVSPAGRVDHSEHHATCANYVEWKAIPE